MPLSHKNADASKQKAVPTSSLARFLKAVEQHLRLSWAHGAAELLLDVAGELSAGCCPG